MYDSAVNALEVNSAFLQKLAADPVGTQEWAAEVIRDHIRENAVNRQIIPMRQIGPNAPGMQVSLEHDTFVKIEWLEPKSRAMVIDFRGGPDARLISGKRMAMGFFSIASEKFEAILEELMVYPYEITKLLEQNTPLDIEEIEDREWVIHAEAAVQAMQKEGNGGTATALNTSNINAGNVVEYAIVKGERARNAAADDETPRALEKPDIAALKRLFFLTRMRADKVLITDWDLSHTDAWTIEDLGLEVAETTKRGFKSDQLAGLTIIRTIKGETFRPGNVYAFAKPNYLGRSYQLGKMQYFAKREGRRLMWWSWETISMAFLNVAGIKKLELYSADANPATNADGLIENFVPTDPEEIFEYRALAHKGVWEPKVILY